MFLINLIISLTRLYPVAAFPPQAPKVCSHFPRERRREWGGGEEQPSATGLRYVARWPIAAGQRSATCCAACCCVCSVSRCTAVRRHCSLLLRTSTSLQPRDLVRVFISSYPPSCVLLILLFFCRAPDLNGIAFPDRGRSRSKSESAPKEGFTPSSSGLERETSEHLVVSFLSTEYVFMCLFNAVGSRIVQAEMRCNACWRELEGRAVSTTCGHLLCIRSHQQVNCF